MYRTAFLSALLFCSLFVKAQANARPNIIVIISDDHTRQAISAYGSTLAQTPHIDRLAKEGALFEHAYVTNSICGPSRAAFLTGKYSSQNGFKDNEHSTFDFSQPTFTKALQAAGYATAWIGKMHLGNRPPQGFDYYNILPGQGEYYNPDFITNGNIKTRHEGYVTNLITGFATNWLDKRDTTKPFCLIIGHKSVHRTWMPDLQDLGLYDDKTFPLPATFYDNYATRKAAAVQDMTISNTLLLGYDLKMFATAEDALQEAAISRMTPAQRNAYLAYYRRIYEDFIKTHPAQDALTEWKYQRYLKDYLATAASMDRNIGRLLDYVDGHGLKNNTIVIYMSDQGFYLGEHGWFDKRWMYEESFSTPMLMRYPGTIPPQTKIKTDVLNIDIAPTLLQLAGVLPPQDMQGVSFLPILKNKAAQPIHPEGLYYHYYENGEHAVSPHFGIKTARYKLIRYYKRVEAWELFDLQKDPHELKNIYNSVAGHRLADILKPQLLQLIHHYKDDEAATIFNQLTPHSSGRRPLSL